MIRQIFTSKTSHHISNLLTNRLSYTLKSTSLALISGLIIKNYISDSLLITNSDTFPSKMEDSLKSFEELLDSKRGKVFALELGNLDFIPRGSTFTTKIRHPAIKEWVYILFVKNLEGDVTAFRANCPYESDKIISKGLVFGNKVVCEHHGCEFHIKTGKVEKYPAMRHLVKLDLYATKNAGKVKETKLLAFYTDPRTQRSLIYNGNSLESQGKTEIDRNVYQYRLPENRKPLDFGKMRYNWVFWQDGVLDFDYIG